MLPRMLLNGKSLATSVQLIKMEMKGRELIRSFSSDLQIDCDLEQDVDAYQGLLMHTKIHSESIVLAQLTSFKLYGLNIMK